jgi:hypothetical protein
MVEVIVASFGKGLTSEDAPAVARRDFEAGEEEGIETYGLLGF